MDVLTSLQEFTSVTGFAKDTDARHCANLKASDVEGGGGGTRSQEANIRQASGQRDTRIRHA